MILPRFAGSLSARFVVTGIKPAFSCTGSSRKAARAEAATTGSNIRESNRLPIANVSGFACLGGHCCLGPPDQLVKCGLHRRQQIRLDILHLLVAAPRVNGHEIAATDMHGGTS